MSGGRALGGRRGNGVYEVLRIEGLHEDAPIDGTRAGQRRGFLPREAGDENGRNGFSEFLELQIDLDASQKRHGEVEDEAVDAGLRRLFQRFLAGRRDLDAIAVLGE